jgi:ABC-type nitrate/sulfonate/bicarbonate transport system permease component
MDFRLRMILWIPTNAYVGFLLLGGKTLASLSQVVTAAFLGALLGFLLATMFTIRQHRREKRFARLGSFEPLD